MISGQVGAWRWTVQCRTPAGARSPRRWANLRAVLEGERMTVANIVKTTVFLTDRALLGAYPRGDGPRCSGNTRPASTLLFVAGLADPALRSGDRGVGGRVIGTPGKRPIG